MTVYNIFFSPTGTSGKIADAVTEEISSALNVESATVDVTTESRDRIDAGPDDLVILTAPVYGGHMAPTAKSRMDIIKGNGAKCVLIAVYGNRAFENALVDMSEFAKDHGLRPIAAGAFVGEHSYSTADTPIAVGRPDAEDLRVAAEFGDRIANKLSAGDVQDIDAASLLDIPSPEQSLANFKEFVISYVAQQKLTPVKLLPEVNDSLCTRCGTCVSVCPTHAIADDCHTVDSAKCIKCCACVKKCPVGARSLHSPFAPVLSANFQIRKAPVITL